MWEVEIRATQQCHKHGVICLDLKKVFDCVDHTILTE